MKYSSIFRKLNIAFFSLVLLCVLIPFGMVYASDSDKGSITIHIKELEHSKSVEGAEFKIYKIGTINEGDKQPVIDEKYGVELPESAKDYEKAAQDVVSKLESSPDYVVKTDKKGEVSVKNVDEGVYIVVPGDTEKYGKVSPFFLIMPYYDNIILDFVYDVVAEPKAEDVVPDEPSTEDTDKTTEQKTEEDKTTDKTTEKTTEEITEETTEDNTEKTTETTTEETTDEDTHNPPKKTGDNAPVVLLIGIIIVSLLAVIILLIKKRKNKE